MSWLKPTSFLIYVTQKKRSCFVFNFSDKEDHAEKVFRKHIDKLFHKDRETRRKDKWEKTKNFFFDLGTKNKKAANHLSHRDSRRPLKTYNY